MFYQNKVHLYWLLSCCVTLLILIIVGGLTRLTDSGLSITNWEIFYGNSSSFKSTNMARLLRIVQANT